MKTFEDQQNEAMKKFMKDQTLLVKNYGAISKSLKEYLHTVDEMKRIEDLLNSKPDLLADPVKRIEIMKRIAELDQKKLELTEERERLCDQ